MSQKLSPPQTWQTSATELMTVFRNALLALVPYLDQARIPWREPDAYDDWDSIAEALFQSIVVRSIAWSLPESEVGSLVIPGYGFTQEDYRSATFIEVVGAASIGCACLAFHCFATSMKPLDTVLCRRLDEHYRVTDSDPIRAPADQAHYCVQYLLPTGDRVKKQNLTVML